MLHRLAAVAWLILGLAAGAPLALAQSAASATEGSKPGSSASATGDAFASDLSHSHLFGSFGNVQGLQQQVSMVNAVGPLPITVSGNVQRWNSGPPLEDLYTEVLQGLFRIDDRWKFVFQQLYQKQGGISLANGVVGFNYAPDAAWSLNATAGFGVHTAYTYRYSLYVSPQLKLPMQHDGKALVSLEADLLFNDYELGRFAQAVPKVNLRVARFLPQLTVGYAFGHFTSNPGVTATQYYQPLTTRGLVLSPVFRPADNVFLVVSWFPNNRNYIAGTTPRQNTVGATLHLNVSNQVHFSLFSQYQETVGSGTDYALGGGVSFNY